ncbi:MAG: hypothetical protein NT049_17790 [Planctomycetota bacterium]|nr:hypothetical protein [Planctomycetota bacterium]
MSTETWSPTEKKIARRAFDAAHEREIAAVMEELRRKVGGMKSAKDLWEIENFLYTRRREFDEKYVYRYSRLIYVFAILYHGGFLMEADLAGLSPDKIEAVKHMGDCFR